MDSYWRHMYAAGKLRGSAVPKPMGGPADSQQRIHNSQKGPRFGGFLSITSVWQIIFYEFAYI